MKSSTDRLEHPLLNPSEFFIDTPMIDALIEQMHLWLWNGITGAVILGQYRIGKTKAIEYLLTRLKSRTGLPIPALRITIPKRDRTTIASLWKILCFAADLTPKNKATADDMSNLMFHYFADLARLHGQNQVVLFVDEMQRLDISQMEAFAELYDRLAEAHINLSTFFVGNREAAMGLITKAESERYELIRGRFFTQSYSYFGIRNQSELRACLKMYDTNSYPEQDGPTHTNYFVGDKCGKEWELTSLSSLIWEVYADEYKSVLNLKSWPMQYFIATIRVLLIDYLPDYGAENEGELRQMISESISNSGLVPSMVRAA